VCSDVDGCEPVDVTQQDVIKVPLILFFIVSEDLVEGGRVTHQRVQLTLPVEVVRESDGVKHMLTVFLLSIL
jgi:hypothetical protein